MTISPLAILVFVIAALITYFSLRRASPVAAFRDVVVPRDGETVRVTEDPEAVPYATRPILSLADYDDVGSEVAPGQAPLAAMELDVIARNTAERKAATKRGRINENHFSTARLPPDSQVRAVDERTWSVAPVEPKALEGFADIEGKALQPQDMDALEAKERAILATYIPKRSSDLMTYSIEDTEDLIKKVYDARKQVASYKKREDGVWEVYEVADKEPKIVWEDDVGGTPGPATAAGDYIKVPVAAQQYAANLDPFFEPRTRLSNNRTDYTAFTPELERMFAPTEPRTNWY